MANERARIHVYAYARQVCATASIWNDRETETRARRSEEEGETGRERREEQQRVVVGVVGVAREKARRENRETICT